MTQRAAYRKAYNPENAQDNTVDVAACRLEAEPKIKLRLEELERIAVEAAHATESSVVHGLMKEATTAKSDSARVTAWQALAKILGINTQDRPVSDLTDAEIEAQIAEYADRLSEERETLH